MDSGRWRFVVAEPGTVFGLLAKEFAMMSRKYAKSFLDAPRGFFGENTAYHLVVLRCWSGAQETCVRCKS
jgi:hypothetical protein